MSLHLLLRGPLPHPLAVISQCSSMTLSWVSVPFHLRVAFGTLEPVPGMAGVGEVTDTSKGCRKVPGARPEPEQSELTRDPGRRREETGWGPGPNLEPRLEASWERHHRQLIQPGPYGLCPKVSLEVMGRKLKFSCSGTALEIHKSLSSQAARLSPETRGRRRALWVLAATPRKVTPSLPAADRAGLKECLRPAFLPCFSHSWGLWESREDLCP